MTNYEVGQYIRYISGCEHIAKIIKIISADYDGGKFPCYILDNNYHALEEQILKADKDICEVLQVDDLIDGHTVWKVVDKVVYTTDGWFITNEDIEDLVSHIVTSQELNDIGYTING